MEEITLLRIVLFSGLILHKVIWEMMKAGSKHPSSSLQGTVSLPRKLVKVAKSMFLILLLAQTLFLDILPMSAAPSSTTAAGITLYGVGLALAIAGRVALGRHWSNVEDAHVLPNQALVTDGIYRFVRHPIYAGDAMLLIGLELALNSWLVVFMVIPIMIFAKQAMSEEAVLVKAFPAYDTYRKRSKAFIPFVL